MLPKNHPHLRIGEVVLRTGRYDEMRAWYGSVLELVPYFEHIPAGRSDEVQGQPKWASELRLCFFRLSLDHPYQQVVALFDVTGTGTASATGPGLHHMQLRDASLGTMFDRYQRLKSIGIVPFRTVDHGPSLSFYYKDPDLNIVDVAASNHASVDAYLASLETLEFKRNPSGNPIDADVVSEANRAAT